MAKYKVTPELAYTIKSARTQKNITSKAIAKHINKSQSYMSRLEKAEIKTIDEKDLSDILMYIYSEESSEPTLESILDSIYSTLELQFSDSEIEQQLWFDNFDTVVRKIPIPKELVNDISEKMQEQGISISALCQRINANEGILPEIENDDDYPFNEWQALVRNHKIEFSFIKMKVAEQEIASIVSGETESANYVSLLAISYYLHKITQYGTQIVLSKEESNNLWCKATDYLNSYRFYSISEKYKLAKQAKSQDERDRLLSTFDRENIQLVTDILSRIKVFSELDIQNNNRVLSSFLQNLDWDLGFVLSLVGMNFRELKDLSYSNKVQLLSEIKELIKKYKSLPDQQKTIDLYAL